jgi:hypothetical protein
MKFIGSAAVAVIVLWCVDELFNDARFARMAIVGLRHVFASIGIHSWRYAIAVASIASANAQDRHRTPFCTNWRRDKAMRRKTNWMCNLYSITTNQAVIIALFRVVNRFVGNLPPIPGVFPDYPAPVVRNAAAERELTMMRWGMPPPPRAGGFRSPISETVLPTLASLVKTWEPVSCARQQLCGICAWTEPETKTKDVVSFALNNDRPLFAFAGMWTEFKGDRGRRSQSQYLALTSSMVFSPRRRTPLLNPFTQGNAGDLDDWRRTRRVDARAMGWSQGAAKTVAEWWFDDCSAGCG